MPRQTKIGDFTEQDECIDYALSVAITHRNHVTQLHGRPVNNCTSYTAVSVIKSALERLKQIRANNRAAEIAASDPHDEPATTVFVGQDGTVGISK